MKTVFSRQTNGYLLDCLLIISIALFFQSSVIATDNSTNDDAIEQASMNTSIQKVLMIHSETIAYSRYFGYSNGFIQTMNNSLYPVELTNMELHAPLAKRNDEKEYNRVITSLDPLKDDLLAGKYDIIIGIGDAAYEVINSNIEKKRISPTTIIAFIGLPQNDLNVKLEKRPNVVGSIARNRPIKTLELACALFPNRKDIILISDLTPRGTIIEEELTEYIKNTDLKMTVFCAEKMSEEELLKQLAKYVDTGIVIYHDWNDPKLLGTENGLSHYVKIVCDIVNKHHIPLFVMRQMLVLHGVVGGVHWNGFDCGKETAEDVISILDGNNIREPMLRDVSISSIVNWPMIERYGINPSKIPRNVVYLNKPDGLFTNYQSTIIWGGGSLFLFFLLLVVIILVMLRNARLQAWNNTIYTKLPIRFFVIDRNENFLFANAGMKDELGERIVAAKKVCELGLPKYEIISSIINSVFTSGVMKSIDFELDGQIRTSFCYRLPTNLYGQETVLWISQDTTELQKTKAISQQNEAQLKLTLNSIGDAVVVADANAKVTMLNPVAELLTGWKSSDAAGKHIDEILTLTSYIDNTPVEIPIKRVLATGKNVELANHTDIVSKDGVRRHVADSASPIIDSDGELVGVVMVIRDVTSECLKNNLIQHQNRQMKLASKNANMAYFSCPCKIPFEMSDLVSELFWGHDQNNRALPLEKWIHPDDLVHVEKAIHIAAFEADKDTSVEYRVQGLDKTRYFKMKISMNSNEFTNQKEFFGIIHDITIEKEQELQLQEAFEAARAADRAKSYFLSTMSHEIRTPLNAVIGFTEMLQDNDIPDNEKEEFLKAISFAGNSLLTLINGVLDLSKLEAGQMKINKTWTDTSKLFKETMLIFNQKVAEKNLTLKCEGTEKLPLLYLDQARIRQILLNLIGNALKFTHSGGVTINSQFIRTHNDTGTFTFSISDTGIGISDEFKEKLFQPFTQQDAIRGGNRKYEGTGLGLSICYKLLDVLGGKIMVDSIEGKGSTFTVVLQNVSYDDHNVEATELNVSNTLKSSGQKDAKFKFSVLVVDDQPANLMLLNSLLRRNGIKSIAVESGKEALQLLEESEFDFVLTDLWMPDMNGIELAEKIRERMNNTDVKIFAITADVDADSNFNLDLFNGILLKPLSGDRVKRLLNVLEENKGANALQAGHMLINELLK